MMITRRAILAAFGSLPLRAGSLPEQSAALALEHAFPDPGVSYLLLEAVNGHIVCSRWPHADEPAPVGSLVKPFTALAYGATHNFRFPDFTCHGDADHCWLPEGHGRLDFAAAIAQSCNAYFLELAHNVQPDSLARVTSRFGLPAPPLSADAPSLIGLGDAWQIPPLAVARAYLELAARSFEPGGRDVLAGLALSARSGTGHAAGDGAYVKTGTAPCIHNSKEPGDGYTVALFPIAAPRFALLVRVHGVPGARAAAVCGRMRSLLRAS